MISCNVFMCVNGLLIYFFVFNIFYFGTSFECHTRVKIIFSDKNILSGNYNTEIFLIFLGWSSQE